MPTIPLDTLQIDNLPSKEDGSFEYKCSQTKFDTLKSKIIKAASAFGNSGGGCFFAGVTNEGVPDGGIESKVGRQSLEDWIDAALRLVTPAAKYDIKVYDTSTIPNRITHGKVILGISFAESSLAPHMADDNKYYIRAGAHSLPASSFIVESLWARRSQSKPMLSYVVRSKPGNPIVVQVGVIALNSAPAIDVEFTLDPLQGHLRHLSMHFPVRIPVVDQNTPFYLDCTFFTESMPSA